MRKILTILGLLAALTACDPVKYFNKEDEKKEKEPEEQTAQFAKGADTSWETEMDSKGCKFFNRTGKQLPLGSVLKEEGFNAIRLRVWVNPDPRWCDKEDVLMKAKRAASLGMDLMIDFHYSDWWADPGKQNVPAAWKDYDTERMAAAVAAHTEDVLKYLKDGGIDAVKWVQIGNEVENGMLWESGRVQGQEAGNFVKYFNAGAAAAKKVYPSTEIILHASNAWNLDTLTWFYDLVNKTGANYDMIGLSLYPSYWQNGGYPDWTPRTSQAVSNFRQIHRRYSKPVMLVEFGMPVSQPDKAKAALQYLVDNTKDLDWFKGIFLWEPESEKDRNGYEYGAFSGGTPTMALDPFNN